MSGLLKGVGIGCGVIVGGMFLVIAGLLAVFGGDYELTLPGWSPLSLLYGLPWSLIVGVVILFLVMRWRGGDPKSAVGETAKTADVVKPLVPEFAEVGSANAVKDEPSAAPVTPLPELPADPPPSDGLADAIAALAAQVAELKAEKATPARKPRSKKPATAKPAAAKPTTRKRTAKPKLKAVKE